MDECKDTWYPFSWYCPNCGTQLIGFKNAEGMIKVASAVLQYQFVR